MSLVNEKFHFVTCPPYTLEISTHALCLHKTLGQKANCTFCTLGHVVFTLGCLGFLL
jgi:hypothetical protein